MPGELPVTGTVSGGEEMDRWEKGEGRDAIGLLRRTRQRSSLSLSPGGFLRVQLRRKDFSTRKRPVHPAPSAPFTCKWLGKRSAARRKGTDSHAPSPIFAGRSSKVAGFEPGPEAYGVKPHILRRSHPLSRSRRRSFAGARTFKSTQALPHGSECRGL